MVPSTRRGLLSVTVGAAAALAGCGTLAGDAGRAETATEPADGADPGPNSVTDPPTLRLRGGEIRPPVWIRDPDGQPRRTARPGDVDVVSDVIASRETANRVRTDGVDADAVAAFLADTDFERESVVLQLIRLEECYTVSLCSVSWADDGFDTDYARALRPYDERCRAEAFTYEIRLIRIPAAFDDPPGGFGTSLGSADCRVGGEGA
ncbi:hypothetical protein RYH80_15255 [Halobaculum sp. MBLA0147]|uniref:hypothetical protein n=1 Tax=Halobaculum sp. MBLA0147 TaxID=3079934 RepID=UPI00352482ED